MFERDGFARRRLGNGMTPIVIGYAVLAVTVALVLEFMT